MNNSMVNIEWQSAISELSKSNYGIIFLTTLFEQLGYFNFTFTTGASIYKNAALNDIAKWLERELDNVDSKIFLNVKTEMKNRISKLENNNEAEKIDEY